MILQIFTPYVYVSVHSCMFTSLRRASTSNNQTYYQTLQLLPHASLKEIKMQFKKLLIKFHPDQNAHLNDEEKAANNNKYVEMVQAYETLKDAKRKREYDATLTGSRSSQGYHSPRSSASDWHNKYYGEAKYYSRGGASTSHTSASYNPRRKVYNAYKGPGADKQGNFSGEHRNYGDRNDVPHFDYNEHLSKHLKFEQRIYGKHMTDAERDAIIRQLTRDGNVKNVSEELITKHLMRNASRSGPPRTDSSQGSAKHSHYMYQKYQGTQEEEITLGMKTALMLGGAGSVYLLYHALLA
ncbi:CIC11C00000003341 [Sungouiella intermedia]|uniref:CIC11C00000003341 n=1 Tax=Sungouiella intermedia TaxID=45354 RepID=A0A1L0BDR3_9ASCO|nr:CIC11C00000003341 [[Candida] intermedia]